MADFVKSDSGSTIRITCISRNGEIFNLTGYTVKLKYRIGSKVYTAKTMTIVEPATDGIAEYNFLPADLDIEGIMYAEVEVENDGTSTLISSTDIMIFTVRGKTIT